ncbi:MAG: DUF975 family protein [Alistipes sp.]|nr:DUF975 family protein [Alistipes sp.]MBQ8774580.1 DUF975 family protein [Alistipes sp.]
MRSNSELRREARATMSGNWLDGVVIALVSMVMMCLVASPQIVTAEGSVSGNVIYMLAYVFIGAPISYGLYFAYLQFCRGAELKVENLFSLFNSKYYIKSVSLYLLTSIYTFLWSLLLVIPGIIKGLSYSMAPYILLDNPELSAEEAICRSMEMMRGHKMDLFLIGLGYAGLAILSCFLLCIPLLWLSPYYMTVFTKFYENLKYEQIREIPIQ